MIYPLFRRALFALDAEQAHDLTIGTMAGWGAVGAPFAGAGADPRLATEVAGLSFGTPIGLAAGLDKDGRAIRGLGALGFGSVEVGTLTPKPQPGNPKPRLFRLEEDRAIINRMGFNNGGLDAALARLKRTSGVLGINVGANKDASDRVADYVYGVTRAAAAADYVTINISSPNTPGLRDLQHGAALRDLLAASAKARIGAWGRTPLFLKVAPDLDPAAIDDIAGAAIHAGVDALIISNTTVSRPPLASARRGEAGGLSGAPLAPLARTRLADFRAATGGALPLISVGGIDSGAEAYARIRAGASLVQVYSALIYEGPGLPARMARDLAALLSRDGFARVADAIGVG